MPTMVEKNSFEGTGSWHVGGRQIGVRHGITTTGSTENMTDTFKSSLEDSKTQGQVGVCCVLDCALCTPTSLHPHTPHLPAFPCEKFFLKVLKS